MPSPFSLIATGPPISRAAATAASASRARLSRAKGTPKRPSSAFDSCSERVRVAGGEESAGESEGKSEEESMEGSAG